MAYASPGNGTLNHLATEMFAAAAGISLTHVPYRGGGPAGLAVATGEVSLALLALPTALPHVQSGRARVLAVMLRDRTPLAPDWPTAREGGVDVESRIWTGFFAQRAVPAPVVATLSRAILSALAEPALRERFAAAGAVPMPLEAPAFGALVAEEARRFASFVRERNFRLD
jgi:tripartite-type tricarboxylate transporter receptor subunit TctC